MLKLFLNKSLVVKSPVFFNFIQHSFGCNNKTVVVQPVLFIMILNRTWTLRPAERFRYGFCPMLRIPPSIRLRLWHCVRQSVCRDGRVGNKPIQAALQTALGVWAGFSAADRFRDHSCTIRRVPECLYFIAIQYF